MRFRVVPYLLSFLSSISLLSHPAVSMKEDLDSDVSSSKPLTRKKNLEDSGINAIIEGSGVVAAFKDLRPRNAAPDKELIGYILKDFGWNRLTSEEQDIVVSKVTGKPIVTDLDALIAKSGVVATFKDLKPHNAAPDKDLIGYILRDSGWGKLTPEEQEIVVSKVTGKPIVTDLDALITTSGVIDIYKELKKMNPSPDKELIGYILRNSGWGKLTPEEQEIVVSKVTEKPIVTDLDALITKSDLIAIFKGLREQKNMTPDKELIGYILRDLGWDALSIEEQDTIVSKVNEKLIPAFPGFLETLKMKNTKKEIPPFPGPLSELEKKIKRLEAELKVLNLKRFPMKEGILISLKGMEANALDELIRDTKAALNEANAQLQIKIEERIEKNKKTFSLNIEKMNKRLKALKQGIQERDKNTKETSEKIIKITKTMDIIELKRVIRTLKLERNTEDKRKAFEEKLGALIRDPALEINVDRMISEEIKQIQLKYSLDITQSKVILSQVYKGLIAIEEGHLHKHRAEIEKLKIERHEIHQQVLNLIAGIEEETQKFQKAQDALNKRKEKLRETPTKKIRVSHSTGNLMEDIRKKARPRTEEELRELELRRKKEGKLFQIFSAAKIPSTDSSGSDENFDDSEEDKWK